MAEGRRQRDVRAKRAIAGIAVIADIARDREKQNQTRISPLINTDNADRE